MTDDLVDDTICELEPLAKRRRTANSSDTVVHLDDNHFWFQDGDIVFGVEQKYFKLHRFKLACSLVFETMFALPQPELAESFDGCPLVKLPQDTVEEWNLTLNWIYDRSSFELDSPTFDVIAKALRISTKYEIPELRQWCRQQLLSRWPENVAELTTTAMSNAAEAICLARELDVPEILPAAFYALSIQRWGKWIDGGRSHMILSPDDLRRFIVGREALQDRLSSLLVNWDSRVNAKIFDFCGMCQPSCTRWLSEHLVPPYHSPYGSWLLRDLQRLSTNDIKRLDACSACKEEFRDTTEDFMEQLQQSIPRYFML